MADQESINRLIKTFHLAVTYLRIYPPSSQLVSATLDAFYKTILSLAETNKTVTLSDLSGKLLVDGKESETREIRLIAGNIVKLFAQRKIQSITFRAGVTQNEISDFLTALLKKKREEMGEFAHIALDQTVYVAMVKGEEAVVKITEIVQGAGGDIAGLMTSLRESYDIIDQVPDPGVRAQLQDHLAEELAKQDPSSLREIFDRDLPPKIEASGLKKRLLGALSQDKIQSIFGEISTWYDEVRKNESSDFAAVDQLEKLKYFLQAVLQAPAAKEIPRQFFEDLLRKGLLSQLPEWFSSTPAQPASVYEVERWLEKPAAELVNEQFLRELPQLAEKLCQMENNDLLGKLIEKLLENANNTAAKIRLPAIKAAAALYEILAAHGKESLLRYMELPVIEAAKRETLPEISFFLMEILRLRARQNVLYGEYELAGRIFDVFHQLSYAETANEMIRSNASKSFDLLVPEIMNVLINDLKTDNEKKRLGSMQILSKLGEQAVEPLIRVIKESDDLRNRRLAALALKNFGEKARKRFAEEFNLGLTGEEIKRVVEALGELGGEEIIAQLGSLLRYPDPSVKKEIMRYLAKLSNSQAKALLIEQLKDENPETVVEAVHLLGEAKCREAAPALVKMVRSSGPSPAVKEEICIALGAIGDNQAVPALIAKLKTTWSLFAKKNNESERVRLRAAWALRKFQGPEVEQALEKAARDKTAAVSMTAKESLAIIRKTAAAASQKN